MITKRARLEVEPLNDRIAPSVTPLPKPEMPTVTAEVRTLVEETKALDAVFAEEAHAAESSESAELPEGPSYTVTPGEHGMLHLRFAHLPEGSKLIVQMPTGSFVVELSTDDDFDLPVTPGAQASLMTGHEKLPLSLVADGKPHDVEKEVEAIKRQDEIIEALHGAAELEEEQKKEKEQHEEEVERSLEEAAEAAREAAEHLEHLAHAHHHHHPHGEHKHEHHEHEEGRREEEPGLTELFNETTELFEHYSHERAHGNGREAAEKLKRQIEHEKHHVEHRLREAYEPVERAYVRYMRERLEQLDRLLHKVEGYIHELERKQGDGRRDEAPEEEGSRAAVLDAPPPADDSRQTVADAA